MKGWGYATVRAPYEGASNSHWRRKLDVDKELESVDVPS